MTAWAVEKKGPFFQERSFLNIRKAQARRRLVERTEIDEDAWSALYSTVSRPFDPPETGKIAVKVINHYGDEVLKVYAV